MNYPFIIYVKCKPTGQVALFETIEFRQRHRDLIKVLNKGTCRIDSLQEAWNTHGKDAFEFGLLDFACDTDELIGKLATWQSRLNAGKDFPELSLFESNPSQVYPEIPEGPLRRYIRRMRTFNNPILPQTAEQRAQNLKTKGRPALPATAELRTEARMKKATKDLGPVVQKILEEAETRTAADIIREYPEVAPIHLSTLLDVSYQYVLKIRKEAAEIV